MVASLADAGLSVIVDHVLLEPAWLPDLAARLAGHEVLFVGVRCPLDVVVAREAARKDRTIGQAAAQFERVHRAGGYDLEVDTSQVSADEAAERVALAIEGGFPTTPFGRVERHGELELDLGGHPRRVEVAALGAAEPGPGVLAQVADVVAALLEDDQALAERGDPPAALVVDGRRQREVADRVLAVGVEPERHDDDVARLVGDPRQAALERREVLLVGRARGQRDVEVRALALPLPGLVLPAEDVRVLAVRVRRGGSTYRTSPRRQKICSVPLPWW